MLGLLIQFLLSYLFIFWAEKGNLSFMGFTPSRHRMKDLLLFLLLAAACSSLAFFLRMFYGQERWVLNPDFNGSLLMNGIWYNLKSVLYEELIFRGVLFYLLIKKMGARTALILSSVAFGIYHWFSYEIFHDPVQMTIVFLITGAAGLVYGLGYLKTGTLYVPIGMHFGWNFVASFLFSNGNTGPGILIEKLPVPVVQVSMSIYFLVGYLPLFLFVLLNILMLFKRKNVLG